MKARNASTATLHHPEVRGEALPPRAITRARLLEPRGDEAVSDGISGEESLEIGQVRELQRPNQAVALSRR